MSHTLRQMAISRIGSEFQCFFKLLAFLSILNASIRDCLSNSSCFQSYSDKSGSLPVVLAIALTLEVFRVSCLSSSCSLNLCQLFDTCGLVESIHKIAVV